MINQDKFFYSSTCNNKDMSKQQSICPRCEKPFTEFPSLSRRDNRTDICNQCGDEEAFIDHYGLTSQSQEVRKREWIFTAKLGV